MQLSRQARLVAALCAADLASTIWLVVRCGGAEANPFMRTFLAHGVACFIMAKLAMTVGPLTLLEWARKRKPQTVTRAVNCLLAFYVAFYAVGIARANMVEDLDAASARLSADPAYRALLAATNKRVAYQRANMEWHDGVMRMKRSRTRVAAGRAPKPVEIAWNVQPAAPPQVIPAVKSVPVTPEAIAAPAAPARPVARKRHLAIIALTLANSEAALQVAHKARRPINKVLLRTAALQQIPDIDRATREVLQLTARFEADAERGADIHYAFMQPHSRAKIAARGIGKLRRNAAQTADSAIHCVRIECLAGAAGQADRIFNVESVPVLRL